MPSSKYPNFPDTPKSTHTPTTLPSSVTPPQLYQKISEGDIDFYLCIWLINNVESENASNTIEKLFYREQLEKYG